WFIRNSKAGVLKKFLNPLGQHFVGWYGTLRFMPRHVGFVLLIGPLAGDSHQLQTRLLAHPKVAYVHIICSGSAEETSRIAALRASVRTKVKVRDLLARDHVENDSFLVLRHFGFQRNKTITSLAEPSLAYKRDRGPTSWVLARNSSCPKISCRS